MIRAVPIVCLLLCVAACAAPAPPRQAVCDIEKTADLPARLVAGAALVPAAINHTAVQLQVDTGASASTVTPSFAAALRLPPDPHHRTMVHAVGGDVLSSNTVVWDFEVGRQQWSEQSLITTPLAHAFNEDPPVAGLLGGNLLSDFDVELDLPQGRMTLWQVHDCAGDFTFHDVPHFRLPLRRYSPNRMVATVQIDGQPLSALIDWGAYATVLNQAAAVRLGLTPEMLTTDPAGHSNGSDRNDIEYRLHRFSEIRIGIGIFHQARIEVAPIQTRDIDILLGLDYVRTRRVWLSYATGQLFVALPSPRPPIQGTRTDGTPGQS